MNRRIGRSEFPLGYFARLWTAAALSATLAWGIRLAVHLPASKASGIMILACYGVAYLALTAIMGIDQAASLGKRLLRAVWASPGR
jgi:hypothetical protein